MRTIVKNIAIVLGAGLLTWGLMSIDPSRSFSVSDLPVMVMVGGPRAFGASYGLLARILATSGVALITAGLLRWH